MISRLTSLLRLAAACCVAALASACATLPGEVARAPSQAIADYASTSLGKLAAASTTEPDGKSGFRLMPIASAAYLTRIELAKRAERSIDLQTFILQDDESGRFLLRTLRDAAARGVRVRVLLDDLYTAGTDDLLQSFAAHPNVELRLFNPFPAGRSSFYLRFAASALDFQRLNHRMHNKLFVVDNAFAVAGGRNIGDEYFMRGHENNFVDIDILSAGPLVRTLSGTFDTYWNSSVVYPAAAIIPSQGRGSAELTALFEKLTREAGPPPPENSELPAPLLRYATIPDELSDERISMIQAHGRAMADSIDKVRGANMKSAAGTVRDDVQQAFGMARFEIIGTTPYYVPGESGLRRVQDEIARGVHVKVTTNSLASTDEPLVHIGYVRYRAALLRAGMELYELSPAMTQKHRRLGRFGSSQGRLHAKVAVIDRRFVGMGSLNMDARSERRNTEIGITIDSPALAQELAALLDPRSAYRLRLAPNREDIEWVEETENGEIVHTDEPEASPWLRFQLWLLSPFVSDDDL